jgi:hypothetical protein
LLESVSLKLSWFQAAEHTRIRNLDLTAELAINIIDKLILLANQVIFISSFRSTAAFYLGFAASEGK